MKTKVRLFQNQHLIFVIIHHQFRNLPMKASSQSFSRLFQGDYDNGKDDHGDDDDDNDQDGDGDDDDDDDQPDDDDETMHYGSGNGNREFQNF